MKNLLLVLLFTITLSSQAQQVEVWLTNADKSALLQKQNQTLKFGNEKTDSPTIFVDDTKKFQTMDGFGAAITGSTCYNLLKMTAQDRAALLKETFDPVQGMGYSYIRIAMGCSDFSMEEYTHCDSVGIENFAIHELDKRDLFPILKEILAINPKVKIMSSPWTPPIWMKVNNLKECKPFPSWIIAMANRRFSVSMK